MFDIGFLELVLIGVVALLVLGPERLPGAARSAGLWIGKLRRMASQFTSEIDKQLKAEEFREKLRKEGDTLGVEHIQGTVRKALDRAKDFEDSIVRDPIAGTESVKPRPASTEQSSQAPNQLHPEQRIQSAVQPQSQATHQSPEQPVAASTEPQTARIDTTTKPQPDQVGGEHSKQS